MTPNSPLFPTAASQLAGKVDALYFFMVTGSLVFSILIVALLLGFALKFRRRHDDEVGAEIEGAWALWLEVGWTVVPLGLIMTSFFWGAFLFFESARPPADALSYHVYGKQWMWKMEHPDGRREINEFHVPLGVPVKVTMTSEDVIHNFAIPAFRLKMDVVPGRYSTAWFKATKTGTYHIFCDQYCGVEHSKMVGKVVVMEPHEYREWLDGKAGGMVQAATGEELFVTKACNTCHRPDTSARAPILHGAFGKPVLLAGGKTVTIDESYVRESILSPQAKIVDGYQPIMPTFKDQLTEEDIVQLINYIKTLKPAATAENAAPAAGGRS